MFRSTFLQTILSIQPSATKVGDCVRVHASFVLLTTLLSANLVLFCY